MKRDVTPTNKERVMREDDFIVSKTDLKGRITYGNRIFIEFSGYTEQELLGSQHNIIRHPDMPRAVFKLLWDRLALKQEVFAYVKNMSKDGGFYWVFAHVTPSYDQNGNVIGYLSVRRKPRPDVVPVVADLYRAMLAEEAGAGARDAMAVSGNMLNQILVEKGVGYDEFILTL
jgi:PAS domain S-box-containing protein